MPPPGNNPSAHNELQPEPKIAPPAAQPTAPVVPATQSSNAQAANQPVSITPFITQVLYGSTAMEKHAAIRQLMQFDWQKNPIIMSALLAGAKNDSIPAVRVDCLRHLRGTRSLDARCRSMGAGRSSQGSGSVEAAALRKKQAEICKVVVLTENGCMRVRFRIL
jgi:hypothetical protein